LFRPPGKDIPAAWAPPDQIERLAARLVTDGLVCAAA
jgi:hypothetical protein